MKYIGIVLLIWLCIVSFAAFCITVYDKWAAKHNPRHRVPEATLLLFSLVGGSVVMLATMLTIRHKTKHMKFMVGIPLILVLQAVLAAAVIYIIK